MEAVKVFIASSKEHVMLAEALKAQLRAAAGRAKLSANVFPWYRDEEELGENILTILIDHCKGSKDLKPSDFFVVLLTKTTDTEQGCTFELGLFLGGLGFDTKRCFVLSSIDESELPPYLKARNHLSFELPKNPQDPDQCANAMEGPAEKIRNQIQKLRTYVRSDFQTINTESLMLRERPIAEEGMLGIEDEVLVNRSQPVEENPELAPWIIANMKAGISYRYFFHDKDSFTNIARLIYSLATVVPDERQPRVLRKDAHQTDEALLANLELLHDHLRIFLMPSPGPIEFCIHNVQNTGLATCYLRYPFTETHILWCEKQSAIHIARELIDQASLTDSPDFIFQSTTAFDLDAEENAAIKRRIWIAIKKRFNQPSVGAKELLENVCFEHLPVEDEQPALVGGWSGPPGGNGAAK